MTRWLTSNVGTAVLAVVMAVMTWVVALQSVDPIISRAWPDPVTLVVRNQPDGTILIDDLPKSVRLTLRGPQSALDRIAVEQIRASVDLAAVPVGEERLVCVVPEIFARGVMLDPRTQSDPACVTVHLEAFERRGLPIDVRVEGKPARGYQLGTPTLVTATVQVAGPSPYLDRIAAVRAVVLVEDARTVLTQVVGLVPVDAQGQFITGITLNPTKVAVVLPVTQLDEFKELVVTVDLQGAVAPGYALQGIKVDPLNVLVTGSPSVIQALPAYVRTTPVDIADARQSVLRRAAIVLPEGVTLVDEQSVLVEVTIESLRGSATVTRTVELQGLGAGLIAEIAPPTVSVILSGPVSALAALNADDVRVVVDVLQLGPGTYTLAPRAIILPEGVEARTILPTTLEITLAIEPTPTPTPTSTPPPS